LLAGGVLGNRMKCGFLLICECTGDYSPLFARLMVHVLNMIERDLFVVMWRTKQVII
jgi:hypothetical protein